MARVPIQLTDEKTRKGVLDLIAALDISKPWQVQIEPVKKKRSLSQNALMWAWLNKVADIIHNETGQDADDVHEFFKAKFLPGKTVEINGEAMTYRTTTKLTVSEMTEYMNKIYAFTTSELGLLLPLPEELGR